MSNLSRLIETLENVEAVAISGVEYGMNTAVKKIQGDAKRLAPVAADLGGRLRNSINTSVNTKGNEVIGTVGTNVDYAPYVEFGTGERGSSSTFDKPEGLNISYSSKVKGMPPQPFLYPALKQNEVNVEKYIINGVKRRLLEIAQS